MLYVCFEKWFTRRWMEVSSGDSTFKNRSATWVNIISATYVHMNPLLSYLLTIVVFRLFTTCEFIQSAIWPYCRKTKTKILCSSQGISKCSIVLQSNDIRKYVYHTKMPQCFFHVQRFNNVSPTQPLIHMQQSLRIPCNTVHWDQA